PTAAADHGPLSPDAALPRGDGALHRSPAEDRRRFGPADVQPVGDARDSPLLARRAPTDQRGLRQGASLRPRQPHPSPDGPVDPPGHSGARGQSGMSLIDDALRRAQAAQTPGPSGPAGFRAPMPLPDPWRSRRRRFRRLAGATLAAMVLAAAGIFF